MTPNPFQGLKRILTGEYAPNPYSVSMTPNPFQGLKPHYTELVKDLKASLNDP